MTTKFRRLLVLTVGLATLGVSSCGHYKCGQTFGSSTCNSSGSGITSGGGTTNATSAFAFAVDTAGTLDGYTLDTGAGTLQATSSYTAPTIPASDFGAGMVVAQGKYLYAAFGSSNQIFGWTVSSSGSLTAVTGSPYAASFVSGIAGFGQRGMITNPAGTLLFFSDSIRDQINVYQIGSDGTLSAVPGSPFSVPFTPVNMTTDGQGKYLYATESFSNHTASEVAAYSIGSNGSLTAVIGSPFAFPMWQVQGEPTGLYLIGTTGKNAGINGTDDDHLYVFSITQTGSSAGAITPVSGSPFPTVTSPFNIAVPPNSDGNVVFSFSANDTETGYNPVEGYQIDANNGALTAVTGSPFSDVASGYWGQFDQSGAYLFVYSAVVNEGTDIETAQLGALSVGSGGVLTQPTSALTLATPGFWIATDPQ
jgi:hypothetical protein